MPVAVVGNEGFWSWEAGRDAGRSHGFAFFDVLDDNQVAGEKLGQQVFLGGEAIGGADGGVQGGVGVFEGVRAGEFQRAVDGAQVAFSTSRTPG